MLPGTGAPTPVPSVRCERGAPGAPDRQVCVNDPREGAGGEAPPLSTCRGVHCEALL